MYTTEERNYVYNHDMDLIEEYLKKEFKLKDEDLYQGTEFDQISYKFKANKQIDTTKAVEKANKQLLDKLLFLGIDAIFILHNNVKVLVTYKSNILKRKETVIIKS